MTKIDLLVVVDKTHADIDKVATSLEAEGFQIQQKLPRFGTIVGTGESSQVPRFQSIDGVESVRPQQTFQLPPLRDDIPQ